MKKLMIALAAVACAAAVQAASFTWKTANYSQFRNEDGSAVTTAAGYNTAMDGGNIVLVLLGTTTSYSWDNATVLTGTSGNTATFKTSGAATVKYGLSTTFSFSYDDSNPSGNILKNNDVIGVMYQAENGDLSKLFYVDSTGTKGADIEATYTISGLTDSTWSGDNFVFTTAGTSASPTYFTAAPEPTSGLLLLLGMAGLALKRKRA